MLSATNFKSISINGQLITFDTPKIMGILNVTPDSFFDGGKYQNQYTIEERIQKLISEGADIIDVGGQSTRPGAKEISVEEELNRVIPVINIISKKYPNVYISIDTYRADVASEAIKNGAHLINDVSAGNLDLNMISTVGQLNVPYIAMHSRGNSQNMQTLTHYTNICKELMFYFSRKISQLQNAGIKDIVIDPGFGFAKNLTQNYELLQNIKYLQEFKKPVLVGLSRKSMIYNALQLDPNEALNGTTILNTWAIIQGADILRVHDVKEAKQIVTLAKHLNITN